MDRQPITRGFRVALYAALPFALLILLYADRRQWFFYDDWEFLATRGIGGQPLDLFRPHNAHWSTIPILVYRALYEVVGLRSYVPYVLVLLALHVATAYVLWRVMVRLGADGWVATSLAIVFLFLGAGYQNLTWAFQIGYIAPLLFGLIAGLQVDRGGASFNRRDVLVWVLAVAGLMCSAVGIAMVAFLAGVALLRRGWRAALITLSVPTVVYVIWLGVIGRHYVLAGGTVNGQTLLAIPDFVWAGLTGTVEQTTGLIGIGAIAVLGLGVWLVLKRNEAERYALAVAGAITAVLFFALDGFERTAGGLAVASNSRYLYVGATLLLPVTAVIVSSIARRTLLYQVAALGLATFALIHGVKVLFDEAPALGLIKQQEEQQILAGAALIDAGAPVIGTHPDVVWAPDLTTRDLTIMVRAGKVPKGTDVSAVNRLDAELALQVETGPTSQVSQGAQVTVTAPGGSLTPAGCFSTDAGAGATITLTFQGEGWVSVESSNGGALVARLVSQGAWSDATVLGTLASDGTVDVSDVVPEAQLVLAPPAGTTTVCGNIAAG